MSDFLKRMNDRLSARGLSGRQDLEMHDVKSVEQGRAVRVLATYSPVYGPPSIYDVQNWLRQRMGEFSDKVQARQDTIAAYPEKNFVTFIVESKVLRQPLSASADMVPAGVDQFIDGDQNLWEVVKAEHGPSYIMKREGTPVEKMLEFRRQALRGGASSRKHVTLAAYDTMPAAGGGFASADVGDTVDFYANGNINRGKVTSVTANGVKVSTSSDSFTIDPAAITSIVEKGAAGQKEQDDVMRRYFSLVYPGNPHMTEIISPSSSKPIKDPRPLQVEPIEKAMSASVSGAFSATVRVPKQAVSASTSVSKEQLEGMGATDQSLLAQAPYSIEPLRDPKADALQFKAPIDRYSADLIGVYSSSGKLRFVAEVKGGKVVQFRGRMNRAPEGDEMLFKQVIESAPVSAAARPTGRTSR